MPERRWSLMLHGGARTIPAHRQGANREGCLAAARIGAAILREGGSALDAAEQVVRQLEDDTTFNAGSGSVPTATGQVELDAAIMDGETLAVGAVAALSGVRNPVSVARLLLKETAVLLVGSGAEAFARSYGIERFDVPKASDGDPQHDTVGCVAMDQNGHFAAATSTGGLPGQMPGRVGDAPIPGAGFYADNEAGAVAISGDGESILRVLLAKQVMDRLPVESPVAATGAALHRLARVGGEAGIIALDRDGRFGLEHNSDHFAVGLAASWLGEPMAGNHQKDLERYLHSD